jgi:lysophospholipase L1-like esterase
MRMRGLALATWLGVVAVGCGGGGGGTGPSTLPTPSTVPGTPVGVTVFQDDNGNGRLDAGEAVRLPQVDVVIAGKKGRTDGGGHAVVENVPAGTHPVSVDSVTLPPYYVLGAPVDTAAPASGEVMLPLRLNIGSNNPSVYMGYGDSLTLGLGSGDKSGYRPGLEARLGGWFGAGTVITQGIDGGTTFAAPAGLDKALKRIHPAYALIMMGTNDWNLPVCQDKVPCPTIDNLESMVVTAKANGSLVILATIPPANPAINADRNIWVEGMNGLIKQMGARQGVVVADVYALLKSQPNLPSLYTSGDKADVHFNSAGYDVIAQAWFDAITHGRI